MAGTLLIVISPRHWAQGVDLLATPWAELDDEATGHFGKGGVFTLGVHDKGTSSETQVAQDHGFDQRALAPSNLPDNQLVGTGDAALAIELEGIEGEGSAYEILTKVNPTRWLISRPHERCQRLEIANRGFMASKGAHMPPHWFIPGSMNAAKRCACSPFNRRSPTPLA